MSTAFRRSAIILSWLPAPARRRMRSVADDVIELGHSHNYSEHTHAGYDGETWVCLDFIDVVVHLFNQESRMYYDLDNLWGEARESGVGEELKTSNHPIIERLPRARIESNSFGDS